MFQLIKNSFFLTQPLITLQRSKGGASLNRIEFDKTQKKCIVMGNGPSLKDDLPLILEEKSSADVMCVNAFPVTDSFFEIKPKYFVLSDIEWWQQDLRPDAQKLRNEVYKRLKEVEWKLQILISHNADFNFVQDQVGNEHIKVIKTKTMPAYRPLNRDAFRFYDTGYFGPPFTNVLAFAVFCAVKAGYETIDIYGADFSYLFLIDVDQSKNHVFIKNEHFYKTGGKEVLKKDAGNDAKGLTMHEFIQTQAWTFKSHELINEYAKEKGIQIFNKSSYSIIDAYGRG